MLSVSVIDIRAEIFQSLHLQSTQDKLFKLLSNYYQTLSEV